MVHSANDIAWAIAEAVGGSEPEFVDMMNEAAARMGLGATHFTNPNGLHDSEQVTSARDIAVLALYLRQSFPQYLPIFETEVVTLGKANMKTNNNLLTHFAGTTGMKTGFVCASGLNIVATIDRGGRSLMAVVLGGSSARERGEMTAGLFLRALSGALAGTGKNIVQVANQQVAPVDMRPLLCGKGAKAYVAQREAEFPLGLDGQPSNLTDDVNGLSYAATDLGVIVKGVPLPRPRPDHARGTMQQAIVEIGPNSIEAIGPNSVESIASDMVETIGPNSVTTPTPVVIGVTPDGAPVPYPRPRPGLQQG